MSHYVECTPGFKDRESLIEALVAVGFDRSQIEVHEKEVPLYGYQGDERPQRAHIVIRREHVGQAANDVGWEQMPDGTYRAWISEYDSRHRFNPEMQNRIKQEYAYHAVALQQRALGRSVQRRSLENGEIEVVIAGYR
jgi:UDP-3-O-acyl-N-acetylglucosamine deacetylase